MKQLNWGHGLVFFTILFMAFISILVYRIGQQKIDLVDKNYYERGVLYQQDINKFNAASAIAHQVVLNAQHQLVFQANGVAPFTGVLHFYRPDHAEWDFSIPFTLNAQGTYTYATNHLQKGPWKATFEWTYGGQLMAAEKNVLVP
jgi:hypothetical protein